ncbi:hypothetical protein KKB40_05345 [Patescibacteria group bacterium]|nr:hypothetical protein [Patescibacteria group bacterium]
MKKQNSYASVNKKWWEKMVKEECGFTKPWLDLDKNILQKLAKGKLKDPPEPLNDIFRHNCHFVLVKTAFFPYNKALFNIIVL